MSGMPLNAFLPLELGSRGYQEAVEASFEPRRPWRSMQSRGLGSRRKVGTLLLVVLAVSSPAARSEDRGRKSPANQVAQSETGQPNATALEGEWNLCFKGQPIEVGRWPLVQPDGKKLEGKEIRGPYQIRPEKAGGLSISHDSKPWLFLLPQDTAGFLALGVGGAWYLGPSFGNYGAEIRARPGGNELEFWKREYTGEGLTAVFTDYTLVRVGTKSYSGAAKDVTL